MLFSVLNMDAGKNNLKTSQKFPLGGEYMSTFYIFLESLEPGVQIENVHSHDDHHHDDQEAQESP